MKSFIFAISTLLLSIGSAEAATPLVCLAGQVKPDGSIGAMSGGPASVVVIQDGNAYLYKLKDPFSLFNTKYNMKQPFNMGLVNIVGKAGKIATAGTVISGTWIVSDDGSKKMDADITIDSATLKGKLENNTYSSGNWTGTTNDALNCTNAGIQ